MKCPILSLLNELLVLPRAIIVLLLASAAALATALIAQFGFGLEPCAMCVWQRIPFAFVIAATVVAMILWKTMQEPALGRVLQAILLFCAAAFVVDAGLSFAHVGVEYGWFPDFAGCSAPVLKAGASIEEMREALLATHTNASCSEATWTLFGISMSTWNVPFTLGLAIFSLLAWRVARHGPLTSCCGTESCCCCKSKK